MRLIHPGATALTVPEGKHINVDSSELATRDHLLGGYRKYSAAERTSSDRTVRNWVKPGGAAQLTATSLSGIVVRRNDVISNACPMLRPSDWLVSACWVRPWPLAYSDRDFPSWGSTSM